MKKYLLMIFLMATGCGGFKQAGSDLFPSENGSGGGIVNMDYQLSVKTGPYSDQLVVDQIRNSMIKVLIPLGANSSVSVTSFSSGPRSVSGSITQDANGSKTLSVNLPVSYVTRGVNGDTVSSLPNGDALDFIESGDAQHFSVPLNDAGTVNLHFYFSPPYLLGVFIQTPFDLASSNKYSVGPVGSLIQTGFFSTHPHRPPLNGGELVFISLPH